MEQAIVQLPVISPAPTPARTVEAQWCAVDSAGRPLVELLDQPGHLFPARFLAHVLGNLRPGKSPCPILLDMSTKEPIILGLIETRLQPVDYQIDGNRLEFDAKRELILRCGPASLTLTRDGQVTIKGVNITSRARAMQKIRGASVQIN